MTKSTEIDDDPEEMIATDQLEIWNEKGLLRTDVTERELAGLSPSKRAQWDDLAAANAKLLASEEKKAETTRQVHRLAGEAAQAANELRLLRPPISHRMALLATINAHKGQTLPVDPATAKAIKKAEAALLDAETRHGKALKAFHEQKGVVERDRIGFFKALTTYQSLINVPTQKDLMLASAKHNQSRAAEQAKLASAAPPSKLDGILKGSGGKRGTQFNHGKQARAAR